MVTYVKKPSVRMSMDLHFSTVASSFAGQPPILPIGPFSALIVMP
jgi:hypothetical protein